MSILHPQECYLLEESISLESYKKRYEAYKKAIELAEARYEQVMRQIPADFRSRPINQQLDITWGSTVFPNLRRTLKSLEESYILRQHGEWPTERSGGAVSSNAKGMDCDMGVDYSWMGEDIQSQFFHYISEADRFDSNIKHTLYAEWGEGDLTYDISPYFGFIIPKRIPRYQLVPEVTVKSGKPVTTPGLYLPNVATSAGAFLSPATTVEQLAWGARQCRDLECYEDKKTGKISYSWERKVNVSCTWTLIRRIEGEYLDVPAEGFFPKGWPEELYNWEAREKQYIWQQEKQRITRTTGEPCPHSGRWATFMQRGMEFKLIQQGQPIPEWQDADGRSHPVKWTLIERDDGGSAYIEK